MPAMKPVFPTGQIAVEAVAKRYAKDSDLDETGTIESFIEHLDHEDASYMLENDGDTTWEGEARLCRAAAAAEQRTQMKRGTEWAESIRSSMSKFRVPK